MQKCRYQNGPLHKTTALPSLANIPATQAEIEQINTAKSTLRANTTSTYTSRNMQPI